MSKYLNTLIDTSGSMAEDCKNAVVKYLLNAITSCDGIEVKNYYLVGNQCIKVEDIAGLKITYGGQMTTTAIDGCFREMSDEENTLLISDGCFDIDTEKAISKHKDKIVCVAVGEDAMLNNLQRCSKNKKVYLAEDVNAALLAC